MPWYGLLWIGGAAGVLVWYARHSGAGWWQMPLVAAGYLILLGAAVAPQTVRRSGP